MANRPDQKPVQQRRADMADVVQQGNRLLSWTGIPRPVGPEIMPPSRPVPRRRTGASAPDQASAQVQALANWLQDQPVWKAVSRPVGDAVSQYARDYADPVASAGEFIQHPSMNTFGDMIKRGATAIGRHPVDPVSAIVSPAATALGAAMGRQVSLQQRAVPAAGVGRPHVYSRGNHPIEGSIPARELPDIPLAYQHALIDRYCPSWTTPTPPPGPDFSDIIDPNKRMAATMKQLATYRDPNASYIGPYQQPQPTLMNVLRGLKTSFTSGVDKMKAGSDLMLNDAFEWMNMHGNQDGRAPGDREDAHAAYLRDKG